MNDYIEKIDLESYFISYAKLNSRWAHRTKCFFKSIEVFEENLKEYFYNVMMKTAFLNKIQKPEAFKEDCIKNVKR